MSIVSEGALIGVDTGGTFTDVTLYDPATDRLIVAKTPSTPHDPSEGFGNGLGRGVAVHHLLGLLVALGHVRAPGLGPSSGGGRFSGSGWCIACRSGCGGRWSRGSRGGFRDGNGL